MNNFKVMKVFYSKQDLQHPSGHHLFRYSFFEFKLSLKVIIQISLFAILFNDVGFLMFVDNLMKLYYVGVL